MPERTRKPTSIGAPPSRLRIDTPSTYLSYWSQWLDLAAGDLEDAALERFERAIDAASAAAYQKGVTLLPYMLGEVFSMSRLDRRLFLALVRAGVEPGQSPTRTFTELAKSLRVRDLASRLELHALLEETSHLRRFAGIESDANPAVEMRRYRFCPSLVAPFGLFRRDPDLDASLPRSGTEVLPFLLEAAARLVDTAAALAEGRLVWSSPRTDGPGWDGLGPSRARLFRLVRHARDESLEKFGNLVAGFELSDEEAVALSFLIGSASAGDPYLPADFLVRASFAKPPSEKQVEALLGPEGRLPKLGLVLVREPEAPLSFRQAALGPLVRQVLALPAKESAVVRVSPPSEEAEEETLLEVVAPGHALADVVLAPEARSRVEELLFRAGGGAPVLAGWGLPDLAGPAAALFYGPPGTGKTFTAEALAGELRRPLLKLKLEGVLSRWVGQAEKRIAAAFRQAREAGAVLFLDEADALLVDRDRTHSHHVPLVNTLLVEIEKYPGLVLLATNRLAALDPAIERRLALKLELAPPGEAERRLLWRRHLPATVPLAPDVDLDSLARRYALSGSEIRSACRTAILRAARRPEAERLVTQADLADSAAERLGVPATSPVGFRLAA